MGTKWIRVQVKKLLLHYFFSCDDIAFLQFKEIDSFGSITQAVNGKAVLTGKKLYIFIVNNLAPGINDTDYC